MNRYSVLFSGRQDGSIGKFWRITADVTAESISTDSIIRALRELGYETERLVCRTLIESDVYVPKHADFDRFDICEAWYLALVDCHGGQSSPEYARLCKLTRPGFFKPSPFLTVDDLNENARAIYDNACASMGCTNGD